MEREENTLTVDSDSIEADAAARGAIYALLARAFEHPNEEFHAVLTSGTVATRLAELLDRTAIDVDPPPIGTDDDYETLCARYNDLFVVGYAEYRDRTDGTLASTGPPVPLYESAYRTDVSWNDVNLDLARAYEYYGLEIDRSDRDNHDAADLQLEFAGYLARREALGERDAALARLDLLDRHLRVFAEGASERMAEENRPGVYGPITELLDRFTAADRAFLADREVD